MSTDSNQQHLLGGSNLRSLGSNLNEDEDLTDDITYGGGGVGTQDKLSCYSSAQVGKHE